MKGLVQDFQSGWQKNEGKWTFDGGPGTKVVPQTDYRNFSYGGLPGKEELSERLELGVRNVCSWKRGNGSAPDRSLRDGRHGRVLPLQAS